MKKIIAIALAVLMLASLATVSFAATDDGGSPLGDVKHTVEITLNLAGDEEFFDKLSVNDGDSVTITAPKKDGYEFVNMVISGDFRQTKVYTTPSVTITPNGDIQVTINYEKKGAEDGGTPIPLIPGNTPSAPAGPVDNSTTSPDTGINVALVALIALLGAFGVAVAAKKLFVK